MSSNVYSSGDKNCLESRDGKSELCFSNNGNSNASCQQAIKRRLEVETEECGGRHLSRTGIVARRLCATALSLRKLTKNTRPTSLREIHLSENETHLSYVKFALRWKKSNRSPPLTPQSTPLTTPYCPPGFSGLKAWNNCPQFYQCENGSVVGDLLGVLPGLLFDDSRQVAN